MTVYVVGLDGADWSLLRDDPDPEARQCERTAAAVSDDLEGFARVVREGVAGGLESTLPPITFPAWKCYSTGKTPGKLGVYEWFAFDRDTAEITTNDASDFRSREYWDVLAEEGLTPAVVNAPTTHPPNTDDGVLTVAGSPASERGEFTKPASLKGELLDEIPDYRVKPDLVLGTATADELVSEAKELVDQRFDAATWLADEKDADVVHLTVFVTDTVQHRLWDRPDRIRELYERVDDRLDALLDRDDADAVVLMSDHGFTGIDETFLVNQWLAERGDLALGEDTGRSTLARVGLTEERLKRTVGRLGLVNLAQSLVPESVQRYFPSESGRTAIQDAPIDWERTKAVSLGRGPVYLNRRAFDSETDLESYRAELRAALEGLETSDGTPVAAAVHDPGEIYTGEMARAPDLVVEYAEGVDAPEAVGSEVFGEETEWLATHRRTGVFGAWGTFAADGPETHLSLYDLAPTLLHVLDVPVPEDVDGEVRTDVLAGEAVERPVVTGPPTSTGANGAAAGDEVEETLRNLGYIE
jgi:predicted AlkP superfamily phosphohydrolase/phosphomutase